MRVIALVCLLVLFCSFPVNALIKSSDISNVYTEPQTEVFMAYDEVGDVAIATSWTDLPFDTETRKDSLYTHNNSGVITLNEDGWYFISFDGGAGNATTRIQVNWRALENSTGTWEEIPGTLAATYHRITGVNENTASIHFTLNFTAGTAIKFQAKGTLAVGATLSNGTRILITSQGDGVLSFNGSNPFDQYLNTYNGPTFTGTTYSTIGEGIYFGDGDSSIIEIVDDDIYVAVGGNNRTRFRNQEACAFSGISAGSFCLTNEVATGNNPTFSPHQGNPSTGIGWAAGGQLTIIADGTTIMTISDDVGAEAVLIQPVSATDTGLTIQGASGQTGNYITMKDSAGTDQIYFDYTGRMRDDVDGMKLWGASDQTGTTAVAFGLTALAKSDAAMQPISFSPYAYPKGDSSSVNGVIMLTRIGPYGGVSYNIGSMNNYFLRVDTVSGWNATIGTLANMHIGGIGTFTGNITNYRALAISDASPGTDSNYAIYSISTSDSYFAGSIIMGECGITAPVIGQTCYNTTAGAHMGYNGTYNALY